MPVRSLPPAFPRLSTGRTYLRLRTEGSQRSIDTITPLANSLGLTIDTSCPNDSNAGACIAGIVAEKNDDLDGGYYGDVVVVFGKDAFSGDAGAVSELHYEYGGETLDDPPVFPDV